VGPSLLGSLARGFVMDDAIAGDHKGRPYATGVD
jgi:hypothetical protein